jgi:hypothetical protein
MGNESGKQIKIRSMRIFICFIPFQSDNEEGSAPGQEKAG